MSTVAKPWVTLHAFQQLPEPSDGSRLELVRGEVVVMPPPRGKHGVCCAKIAYLLMNFVMPRQLGWVTTNDSGVILERNPDTVRGPDLAFWSITRQPVVPDGYFEIPPDLAVEVLSPTDRRSDVRAKIKDYLFYGVSVVWLVDPETQTVMVYTGNHRGVEYDTEDTLDGGVTLPGFTCRVADFFV